MKQGIIRNQRTGQVIAERIFIADSFCSRLRGLIGRETLQHGEGLWLIPCKQVHMFGMKYPLSIWFLDETGRVSAILDDLKPWQISPYYKHAFSALEFPSGWGAKTGTKPGDLLISE